MSLFVLDELTAEDLTLLLVESDANLTSIEDEVTELVRSSGWSTFYSQKLDEIYRRRFRHLTKTQQPERRIVVFTDHLEKVSQILESTDARTSSWLETYHLLLTEVLWEMRTEDFRTVLEEKDASRLLWCIAIEKKPITVEALKVRMRVSLNHVRKIVCKLQAHGLIECTELEGVPNVKISRTGAWRMSQLLVETAH
jgi:ferric iron reductase protein FhuF